MKPNKRTLNPTLKVVLDIGPLLLFFVANARPGLFLPLLRPLLPVAAASGERTGIFVATAVFMIAVVIALAVSYALTRHLPLMPLVTAVVVLVFGSLTLVLHDELFIKLKPMSCSAAPCSPDLHLASRSWAPSSTRYFISARRDGASSHGAGPCSSSHLRCSTRSSGARRRRISG
jgi:hypothetical protein